jgi:hypothetical protein
MILRNGYLLVGFAAGAAIGSVLRTVNNEHRDTFAEMQWHAIYIIHGAILGAFAGACCDIWLFGVPSFQWRKRATLFFSAAIVVSAVIAIAEYVTLVHFGGAPGGR